MIDSPAERARSAARNCEAAGLSSEADMLFRLRDDPECVRNLAYDLSFEPIVQELRTRMMALLREDGDPRALGQADVFDTYRYIGKRDKGYETWLKKKEAGLLEALGQPKPAVSVR